MNRKSGLIPFLVLFLLLTVMAFSPVIYGNATDLKQSERSTNEQLLLLKDELAQIITSIEETAVQIEQQKVELSAAEDNLQKQSEAMQLQIQYIYENDTHSMLDFVFNSQSFADLITNVEYVQAFSEYNDSLLTTFEESYISVMEKGLALQKKRTEFSELQTNLEGSIAETESALSEIRDAIEAERQRAALEAEMARARELAQAVSSNPPEGQTSAGQNPPPAPETPSAETPSETAPPPPSGGTEALYSLSTFKRAGVIYWNDYKFTYYSQSVLPGYNLNIPGRHVNASGYVSDGSGYICLAGSAPMGTVYDTPFGYQGKIYDRGVSGNHLDVYIQ